VRRRGAGLVMEAGLVSCWAVARLGPDGEEGEAPGWAAPGKQAGWVWWQWKARAGLGGSDLGHDGIRLRKRFSYIGQGILLLFFFGRGLQARQKNQTLVKA